jgi:LysR family hydrogen peroxide-inducible transcriptional activator
MNLRDLEYLNALIKHKHFGKAAAACFVSQPALSSQIKKLEDELGVALIERHKKSFFVTEIGNVVHQKSLKLLELAREIENYCYSAFDQTQGKIKFGLIPTSAPYILPFLIPEINKHFPKIELIIIEDKTNNLIKSLEENEVDLAILVLPLSIEGFHTEQIANERFMLAVGNKHPLYKAKEVNLKDLKNEEVLLLDDGHCLKEQTLEICKNSKFNKTKEFKATSLETLRQMVALNVGVTLIPELAVSKNETNLKILPFKAPAPSRNLGLVWRQNHPKNEIFKELATHFRNRLNEVFKSNK